MKSPDEITADIARYLKRTWPHALIESSAGTWPHRFSLGSISRAELDGPFVNVATQVQGWYRWVRSHNHAGLAIVLETSSRRVASTTQTIPTHLTIDTIDVAARIVGDNWPELVTRQRQRRATLGHCFPTITSGDLSRTLRDTASYGDVDFQLLCDVATWFETNQTPGLTPRQVPIPGIHAKWLNTSQHLVQRLAGLDTLDLARSHPSRVHLTYLDPIYRASGARRYDVAAVGDTMRPAYLPELIVISENKDTAVGFPETPNAIAIEGDGKAGPPAISDIPWVHECPSVFYWGDIDAEGFEIVNSYRACGLNVTTILMDVETYQRYKCFGTRYDQRSQQLTVRDRRALPFLTPGERQMYHALTDPDSTDPLRLEQERIPLRTAKSAVSSQFRTFE